MFSKSKLYLKLHFNRIPKNCCKMAKARVLTVICCVSTESTFFGFWEGQDAYIIHNLQFILNLYRQMEIMSLHQLFREKSITRFMLEQQLSFYIHQNGHGAISVNELLQYGCWGQIGRRFVQGHGKPMDELDSAFRRWHLCRKCIAFDLSTEQQSCDLESGLDF